jgi:protocatechuate 3,4-dioxygenase beta subunit
MRRDLTRRSLLAGVGTAGVGLLLARPGAGDGLSPTPRQIEGPFYPVAEPADKDLDLTRVEGRAQAALGVRVVLDGSVRTLDGAPVAGALVEIWQACATGRYNHPRDRNPAPLDPDFQYWGRVAADASGH